MVYNLEYNSERNKLVIPEYGRHIQKMIEITSEVEDDKKRNEMALAIIQVMGNLSPHLRDVPDFQEQLWDQLFMMSDYKLDVESPFPKPTAAEKAAKPEPLPYPENSPKYRFYGNNIKKMIDAVAQWEEGPKKEGLILTIANHMKKSYLNWNKDTVEDSVIFKHLYELSDGKIDLNPKEEDLSAASNLVKSRKSSTPTKRRKSKRHPRGRKRN